MRMLSALVSILIQSLSAPIAIAALLAVPLRAGNEAVKQHTIIPTLSSEPIRNPLSTPNSVPSNSIILQSPTTNSTLSPPEVLTASIHFHIPETSIDLTVTSFDHPLSFITISEAVDLAIDKIATNVGLHPDASITNGFFQQYHEGLAIRFYQYVGKEISWSMLNQLLLGIQYFTSQLGRSREMRFEIDVWDQGRVGYGSLWHTGVERSDVARRATNETSRRLLTINLSEPALINSNHSMPSPTPEDSAIVFSYHFFGPTIPEPELSTCFRLARQSIRPRVQLHPRDSIPDGFFQYRAEHSAVSVGVTAYVGKEISWLLLDEILRHVGNELIGQHHLLECDFEFEIYPFEEPVGHGSLRYDTAPKALPSAPRSKRHF